MNQDEFLCGFRRCLACIRYCLTDGYRTYFRESMNRINEQILELIKAIPAGKVAGYAQIAAYAGLPGGARMVARLLHACSSKHNLPWWRVLRSSGEIALPEDAGGALQKELLTNEGITFNAKNRIDMAVYSWVKTDTIA